MPVVPMIEPPSQARHFLLLMWLRDAVKPKYVACDGLRDCVMQFTSLTHKKMTVAWQVRASYLEHGGLGFEFHLGLRFFLCPLMVDSLQLYFLSWNSPRNNGLVKFEMFSLTMLVSCFISVVFWSNKRCIFDCKNTTHLIQTSC